MAKKTTDFNKRQSKCPYCHAMVNPNGERAWSWVHDTWTHEDCFLLHESYMNATQSGLSEEDYNDKRLR